jgi:hypothetical protein
MLLFINKRPIDITTPHGKYVTERVKYYSNLNKEIVIESYLLKQPHMKLLNGLLAKTSGYYFASQENFNVPGYGNVTINLARTYPDMNKEGGYKLKRIFIPIIEKKKINTQTDPELAFFVMEVSSVKDKYYSVKDQQKEDKLDLDKMVDDGAVKYIIGSPNSPLSPEITGSEEKIRELAASWNIYDSETMPLVSLRKTFINAVLNSESRKETTKRGFVEFMKDVDSLLKGDGKEIKIRGYIQKAIEKKVIVHDVVRVMIYVGTPIEKELLRHRPSEADVWIDKVVSFFINNPGEFKTLTDELDYEKTMSTEDKARSYADLSKAEKIKIINETRNWGQLRGFALEEKVSIKKEGSNDHKNSNELKEGLLKKLI